MTHPAWMKRIRWAAGKTFNDYNAEPRWDEYTEEDYAQALWCKPGASRQSVKKETTK